MTDKIDDETRAFKDEMRKLGLTAKGMLAFEKYAAEAERYREPSKDFGKISRALELVREIFTDEDDEISIEYDYTHGTIFVRTYLISVSPFEMDKWRELMDIVDLFTVDMRADDRLYVELKCNDIFEVPSSKELREMKR